MWCRSNLHGHLLLDSYQTRVSLPMPWIRVPDRAGMPEWLMGDGKADQPLIPRLRSGEVRRVVHSSSLPLPHSNNSSPRTSFPRSLSRRRGWPGYGLNITSLSVSHMFTCCASCRTHVRATPY